MLLRRRPHGARQHASYQAKDVNVGSHGDQAEPIADGVCDEVTHAEPNAITNPVTAAHNTVPSRTASAATTTADPATGSPVQFMRGGQGSWVWPVLQGQGP